MDASELLYWAFVTSLVVVISVLITWRVLQNAYARKLKKSMDAYKATGRSTLKGQISEQLAPLLPPMLAEYNARDLRFLGSPVDFVAFMGMSDNANQFTIHFLEVKTGGRLNPNERKVQEAVEAKRIEFRRIDIEA